MNVYRVHGPGGFKDDHTHERYVDAMRRRERLASTTPGGFTIEPERKSTQT